MEYFKISLETKPIGNKPWEERILYVQCKDIIGAMDISKKIKFSKLNFIHGITEKQYLLGVAKKYD